MKKLITIITLFASTFVYADETITAESIHNNIKTAFTNGSTRTEAITANIADVTAIYTTKIAALNNDITTPLTKYDVSIIRAYLYVNTDVLKNLTLAVATRIASQYEWLVDNGVSYSTIKSGNFTYNGVSLNTSAVRFIIENNDYSSAKLYPSEILLFDFNNSVGVNFITDSLLGMTDTAVAYEDSLYWENIAIKNNNSDIVKKLQSIQDIIYLRTTRASKLK